MVHKDYIWGTEDWIYQDEDVLIKLIDAKTPLSVQVHPDDEYARINENGSLGKNEMWYILDTCRASDSKGNITDAYVYAGVKDSFSKAEIRAAAESGTLEDYLVKYPVKPGDVINIPAGTIHAIGGGCRILEIQQSSTITYRLYDYKRLGADGKPRELHLKKALDVAVLKPTENLTRLPLKTGDFTAEETKTEIIASWTASSDQTAAGSSEKKQFVFKK